MTSRFAGWPVLFTGLLLALGSCLTSCGGSAASPLPAELSVIDVSFVFPNDAPLDPTLRVVPRNTWIRIEFTKPVEPETLNSQTIRVRGGANLATEPRGTLRADGNVVRFDPTVGSDGTPNPFGFAPSESYRLEIRSFKEASGVVRSIDDDPVVNSTTLDFSTTDGFLHESIPPTVLGVRFLPERDPTTGAVPANAICFVDFDEVIDVLSVQLGRDTFEPHATFDVRYTNAAVNAAEGVAGRAVPGQMAMSPNAKTIEFRPLFGYGPRPFEFEVRVTAGITDLPGNALRNPAVLGTFTCDGDAADLGTVLNEDFVTRGDMDVGLTDADWGVTEVGVLAGQPITTRNVHIMGSSFADTPNASSSGTYTSSFVPLIGTGIDALLPNLQPPSAQGRRVMYSFGDFELGAAGTITALAWGPDSNATFTASYTGIKIRAGIKVDAMLNLFPRFSDNVDANGLTTLYQGGYTVPQALNIGNTVGLPLVPHKPGYGSANIAPCNGALSWNKPLFDFTGFQPWPALQTSFDWDPGVPNSLDVVLLLDFSVPFGTSFQTIRSWFGDAAPCSGVLTGTPLRKVHSTANGELANPATQAPVINPEPTVDDIRITFSRIKSLAQSRFYTPRGHPWQSPGGATFGVDSDYGPAIISRQFLRSSSFEIEYQGATDLDGTDPSRQTIDMTLPFTPWTTDVNACDRFPFIRWRIRLIGNAVLNEVGKIPSVQIPVRDLSFVK